MFDIIFCCDDFCRKKNMFASSPILFNCGQQDDSAQFVAILLANLKVMKSIRDSRLYDTANIFIFHDIKKTQNA